MEIRKVYVSGCPDREREKLLELLNRCLAERECPPLAAVDTAEEADLAFYRDEVLPPEAYVISGTERLSVRGADYFALVCAAGRLLHKASFRNRRFEAGMATGSYAPAKPFRFIYFASHFFNYYHVAPLDELRRYIEDLALWGYNGIALWVDKHHYCGIGDPELQAFLRRIRALFGFAHACGMKTMLISLANEGYADTPEALRATPTGRSFYGCEICPSAPGGLELIAANHCDTLAYFQDMPVDFYSIGSYDQGGCGCKSCYPYGVNGMFRCGEAIAEVFHRYHPEGRIVYTTWLFDYCGENAEWRGLEEKLRCEPAPWLKLIMADSHGCFPEHPLRNGVPGNRPLLNFPEISMWGMLPWNVVGFSAQPSRFQRLFRAVKEICSGGYPYSEGIFEDFNKVLYAYFYWDGTENVDEAVEDYCRYEFGARDCDRGKFAAVLDIFERNHTTMVEKEHVAGYNRELRSRPGLFLHKEFGADPEEALRLTDELEAELPEWGRKCWRFRQFRLRAVIDRELQAHPGELSAVCEQALAELAELYRVDRRNTSYWVAGLIPELAGTVTSGMI